MDNFVTKVDDSRSKAYSLLVKADALRHNELFRDSLKFYLNALLIEKNNENVYLGLASSYKALQKYEKAIDVLKKALEVEIKTPKLYCELGVLYNIIASPDIAIKYFQKAITLDKKNYEYQIQLAIAHELMDEQDMALSIYQTIMEKSPDYLNAYNHKAALFMNSQDFYSAACVFKQILSINPKYEKAFLGIGICLDKLGEQKAALRYYKKFIDCNPDSINCVHVKHRIDLIKDDEIEKISTVKLSIV